jgi:hypothetical protein
VSLAFGMVLPGLAGVFFWPLAFGGFEEVEPVVLAVPLPGQVHDDVAAAVAGDPGGDGDQVAAQRGASCLAEGGAGQDAGGAEQVEADRGAGQPGGVGGERAGGQVGQRPVGEVGEDLLALGVAAVLGFGLGQDERGVGEDRVLCRADGYAEPRPRMTSGAGRDGLVLRHNAAWSQAVEEGS